MSTSDSPQVVIVQVPSIQRSLSFDSIFSPLAQSADTHLAGGTLTPEVATLIQKMKDLSTQLNDVINQIDQLAPGLLAPTANL